MITDRDQEGDRRFRREVCTRGCGLIAGEVREERKPVESAIRFGEWVQIPNEGNLIDWIYPKDSGVGKVRQG